MTLEVVVLPVADVDVAKEFYGRLGWRLDADKTSGKSFRLVQFTPPGSGCAVQFGTGLTDARPGSAHGLHLVVADVPAVRDDLVHRGVTAGPAFHCATGFACRFPGNDEQLDGPHPDRATYGSFFTFADADGNTWIVQEITTRLPGRVTPGAVAFRSTQELSRALQRAAVDCGAALTGSAWADQMASWLVGELADGAA
jgi:catechol 2,3-dioxygenase-like lactoylglutathione lyase family enzyme